MTHRRQLPQDFTVTDHHRDYAESKGWPRTLPDVFLAEFKEHFTAKGTRWKDWDMVFQRWMRQASPAGDFYRAEKWEAKLMHAKSLLYSQKPALTAPTQPMPKAESAQARERRMHRAKQELEKLRQLL